MLNFIDLEASGGFKPNKKNNEGSEEYDSEYDIGEYDLEDPFINNNISESDCSEMEQSKVDKRRRKKQKRLHTYKKKPIKRTHIIEGEEEEIHEELKNNIYFSETCSDTLLLALQSKEYLVVITKQEESNIKVWSGIIGGELILENQFITNTGLEILDVMEKYRHYDILSSNNSIRKEIQNSLESSKKEKQKVTLNVK